MLYLPEIRKIYNYQRIQDKDSLHFLKIIPCNIQIMHGFIYIFNNYTHLFLKDAFK